MVTITHGCLFCGHRCRADRGAGEKGLCGAGQKIAFSQALIHRGEEPPISGPPPGGSGAIFLAGCNLSCVFCQNHAISQSLREAVSLDPESLVEIMFALKAQGAVNVNLVSPSPHALPLAKAIARAKTLGLGLPVVYNTGGYDSLEALKLFEGLVDIYLPDAKIAPPDGAVPGDIDERALRLFGAADYAWVNRRAIAEMFRQVGPLRLNGEGLAYRGLLVRHLVLPDNLARTDAVLPWVRESLGEDCHLSLMAQYFPTHRVKVGLNPEFRDFPGLGRPLSLREYDACVELATRLGLMNAFTQDLSARSYYRPDFSEADPFGG
ncbi:MAG: radical SAM protein [Deltaproteobacteria bacterium]|jgi:putative pyruvate formate lyase activating enzyme|nr:radical SAM protein [Deltaproteobacteria bacterium]